MRANESPSNGGPGDSPEDRPLLLTVKEVCGLLHRSRARVYEMVRLHELGHLKDGRSVLIPREALDEWIRKKRRQTGC